ncbi:hypothetical protein ASE00_10265 [Sphingomonas sp. Root710]|uniref:hypothetical protein n=1 Tax=Sphingomonas sp. Root710 TaxID=1736594 RepID=UPI0006F1D5AD|nr:hypothetical protein [Sphingomonas sp. Root710]KRB82438.1 hypothetical protein ASE00_10265 [Sphingomonas sp. Root710]
MSDIENQDLVRELDPFGFMIGHSSAIKPLGGGERGPDPRYVFHTPYIAFRPGRVTFTIHIDKLQASFGELRVHINAFVHGSGRDAIFVTSSRLDLTDRAAAERGMTISVLAVAGATYAAYGFCLEGTDARAAGIRITAEESGGSDGTIADELLLPTQWGTKALETPFRLVGDEPVRLSDPVSQPMTEEQLAEPDFTRWSKLMPAAADDERLAWQLAFAAQALDRYGMLQPGARGLALGQRATALAPVMAAHQCHAMVATVRAQPGGAGIHWDALPCLPIDAVPGPDGRLHGIPLSIADQPADERGFDFIWSLGAASRLHVTGDTASFLTGAMMLLRPGGYAVHMFDLATGGDAPPTAIPRAEVERIAIMLISRNFSVAQLNFAAGTGLEKPFTPFGLIVRKG